VTDALMPQSTLRIKGNLSTLRSTLHGWRYPRALVTHSDTSLSTFSAINN